MIGARPSEAHTGATAVLVDELDAALVNELQEAGRSAIAVSRNVASLPGCRFNSTNLQTVRFFPNKAPWRPDLENELFAFPFARHDDQVDSISQALAYANSSYDLEAMVGNTSHMNIFSRYGFPMP